MTPKRISNKSLVTAGVFTVLGLAVLLSLGFWQIERLAWKKGILARIEANMNAEPVAVIPALGDSNLEYSRACVSGKFLHKKELYVFAANLSGEGGINLYTPMEFERGRVIIVNRGWVPNALKSPETRAAGQLEGVQKVCGVLRLDRRQGFFTPGNNPEKNRWFTPEVSAMAQAAGVKEAAPFFLEADNTPNPGGYPIGGQTFVNIPNNHLGYAITWFGLAVALLGVFSYFAFTQRRKD